MAGRKKTAAAGGSTKQKKEQEQYLISELDQYLFGQGTHYDIFRKLGAHPMTYQGKKELHLLSGRQMRSRCM